MARFFNQVLVQDTTDCTAANTGSAQTKGGLYVAKQTRIGGILNVLDSTASTTTLNGSIVTPGGVGCGTLSVGAVPNLPSQTAKTFFAAPNGSAGAPTFRAIQGSDVPVFVASGASNAAGAVPAPGSTAGTTKFLREDATWAVPPGGSGMTNPMTTAGDVIYGAATGTPARLGGNTSTAKQYLTSTGTGSAANAPLWSDLNTDVLAQVLTGYADAGSSSFLTSADSILVGFGKLQKQIKDNNAISGAPTGSMMYSASGTPTLLSPNNTTTKMYLRQTGLGVGSTAPVWQDFNADVKSALATAGVTSVAYAATINIDMTTITTPVARIALTGPATINFTGGTDGQKLTLELVQDATGGRVATLGTGVAYGADITSYSGNTGASKTDILGFQYFAGTSKARLIAVAKGY